MIISIFCGYFKPRMKRPPPAPQINNITTASHPDFLSLEEKK